MRIKRRANNGLEHHTWFEQRRRSSKEGEDWTQVLPMNSRMKRTRKKKHQHEWGLSPKNCLKLTPIPKQNINNFISTKSKLL